MTWKVLYRTFNDDVLHLTGDESFILRSGAIHFSNGTTVPLIDGDAAAEGSARLIEAETKNLIKAVKRAKRTHTVAKVTKWAALGGFLVVSLLVVNGALVSGSRLPSSAPMFSMEDLSPAAPQVHEFAAQPTAPSPAQPEIEPAVPASGIAAGIRGGVERGDVTIRLGPEDAEQTLYVFADPLCPHCQNLEPTLHELADSGVRVEVFPVSVIGGANSVGLASAALCQPKDDRAETWIDVASGNPSPGATEAACETGDTAIDTNNAFFRAARFTGTPTLLNERGEQPPSSVSRNAGSIREWLSS